MGLFSHDRERQEVDDLMRSLGFGLLVPGDRSARPERMAWYGAAINGRSVVTTITGRRVTTLNVGIGNRHQNVVVLTIIMVAHVGVPFGFGSHTKYGSLATADIDEMFPPDHPGSALPLGVKQAFLWFARALIPPGQPDHNRYARYIRIADTEKLSEWLPEGVLGETSVLVAHELPLSKGWQSRFDKATTDLGWVAHAIEEAAANPNR